MHKLNWKSLSQNKLTNTVEIGEILVLS